MKITGCFFLFFLFIFHGNLYAQNNAVSELKSVAAIFQNEFNKAGIESPGISLQGKWGNKGIQIDLITINDSDPFELRSKSNDAFYLRSGGSSIYLTAKTVRGLRNAAYYYLHQLGFRYYFPESSWHFIPKLSSPYKEIEKLGEPSFLSRRIWYAYGTDSKQADTDYKFWTESNLLGGEEINAGHAYEGIVNRNKKIFLEHPEFFAQKVTKGSIPKNPKFEISNNALVSLVVKDALNQVENYIKKTGRLPQSISMDPSDGGGFSTSKASLKIGGPSEQVFYLANQVAKSIRIKYPSVSVGLYAYNFHAAPPKFSLESNIVVLIATAYNQSTYTLNQLIELWKAKGVKIGIRDYFGVLAWDWDMPGQVRGSKTVYINQIKEYHKNGALYFSAETNIGWVSRGLGHYLASRLLWDVNTDIETAKAEFFQNMFGKANKVVEKLYSGWEQYSQQVPMDGNLLEWVAMVSKAEELESDIHIQARLNQIKQYLYYVYLYKIWKEDNNDKNLISLLNFAYRIKSTGVVSSYPLFRTLANSAVAGKQHMRFNDPEARWKINDKNVSDKELNQYIKTARSALNPREKAINTIWPDDFSTKFNSTSKNLTGTSKEIKLRGVHRIVFTIGQSSKSTINLSVGHIKANNFRPLTLKIYAYDKAFLNNGSEVILLESKIEPKKPLESISLSTLKPGSYIAVIDDAGGGFVVSFTGIQKYGIVADNQSKIWTLNRSNLFFEVKEGSKDFIIHTDGVLTLKSPSGRIIDFQNKTHPLVNIIKVKSNEAGIWQMQNQSDRLWIQGVLPLLCPEEQYLLRE